MVFYPYIRHISSHISGIFHESNCFFPPIYGSWGHPQVENGWYHPKPNSVKGPTWKWTGWWFQFQLFSLKGGVSMFLCSLFSVVSRCSWSETSAYFQVTISLFYFPDFFSETFPATNLRQRPTWWKIAEVKEVWPGMVATTVPRPNAEGFYTLGVSGKLT